MQQTYPTVRHGLFEIDHLSPELLARSLSIISDCKVDCVDIYYQYTTFENWHLEEGIVKSDNFQIEQGVGVRAVSGEKTAFAYAGSPCIDSINRPAHAVRVIGTGGSEQHIRVPAMRHGKQVHSGFGPITSFDSAAKVALLNEVETLAKTVDPHIVQIMAGLTREYDMVYITRLDGRHAAGVRPMVRLSVTVIIKRGDRREQDSAGGSGHYGLAYFNETLMRQFVDSVVKQALINLESRPTPAGEVTTVLDNGWPDVLLHEAVGHGLGSDFDRKETSVFSGRIGERVTAKDVTVIDQGGVTGGCGPLNIDDEGDEIRYTVLIRDGVLVDYIQDETSARLMDTQSTGNSRRENYASVPVPRITNTLMENGDYKPNKIIASIDKGIYAVDFGGGQVDTTSGEFVSSAPEAWWVEGDELQYPVKGAIIIGNGPEVLKYISMIGNDTTFDSDIGVYGKDGQSIPIGVGQPILRINVGLTVGGSEI